MLKRIATLLLGIGLIGLGVLFFVSPERAFAVQILMRCWPVFLILAGIVRVAGYLIDRHPRSPIGGMMIAAIGGILLSANLLGHNSFLLILGKYWFWILLAFIAGRVVKQYTHRIEDGVRTNAFAPGAVALMILIVGGGLAANYWVKSGRTGLNLQIGRFGEVGNYFFGNQYPVEDEPPQTFAIAPNARLIVNDANGDIEINSAPQPQATARLIKRIRAASEEDAKEVAKNIHLQVASDNNYHQFNVASSGVQQDFNVSIIVTVPQNAAASVEITNALGAVKLNGLRGDHTIRNCERAEVGNNFGSVMLENPRGPVEINQVQGQVGLTNTRRDLTLRGINGPITLEVKGGSVSLDAVTGPVQLQAADARIEMSEIGADSSTGLGGQRIVNIEEARNSRITLREIKGAVAISAERSRIEAEEVSGDLTVNSSFERIKANRIHGALRIKATDGAVEVEEVRGHTTIEATKDIAVRNFAGALSVTSRQGSITIETAEKITGDIQATNDNGRIRVSIPENSAFQLRATANRGRVRVKGFDHLNLSLDERREAMGYNLSQAGPTVVLRSASGDIQVQSAGLALAGNDE
jgi:DUF4097 and DUF4098 domain-containing protein YvlB/uncharacterized membrane protein HdeD (DUF308 family)